MINQPEQLSRLAQRASAAGTLCLWQPLQRVQHWLVAIDASLKLRAEQSSSCFQNLPCVMLPNAFLCQALVRPIKLFKRCGKAAYCYCVDLFSSVYFSYSTSMQSRACLSCLTTQRLCVASCPPALEEQDGECSPFGLRGGHKAMGSPGRVEHQQGENRKRTYSNRIERSYSRLLSF